MTPRPYAHDVNQRPRPWRLAQLAPLLGLGACVAACSDNPGTTHVTPPPLTVTEVSPDSGPVSGGTVVTIIGANFPTIVDSVRVGTGRLGSLVRVSSSVLTGTTPANSVAGIVDVTVYVAETGSALCAGCFTYFNVQPTLTVSGITPNYGTQAGGTRVMIWGNFLTVDSIRLGVGRLPSVSGQSSLVYGITPPSNVAGPVDVTVHSGQAYGVCRSCFTYHSPDVLPHYSVTYLDAGFDSSLATDINDSGVVVGRVWSAATGWRGRLWPGAGSGVDLDTILPVAVNNRNTVVANLATQPVLWESGALRTLGGVGQPDSGLAFAATDINNLGHVALGLYGLEHGALVCCVAVYIWQNDSLTPLSTAPASAATQLGRMNDKSEVSATSGEYGWTAVILSPAGPRWIGLGRYSRAVAVNDAGLAVGWSETAAFAGYSGGYLFGVGPLPFYPTAINDSAHVVGGDWMWQDSAEATISSRVTDPTWQISGAVGINNRGQIAAYGVNTSTGQRGAVRLDPVPAAPGSPAKRRR